MIVWMVWDNRDRCNYRLKWDGENWRKERYVNTKQGWVETTMAVGPNKDTVKDIIRFVTGDVSGKFDDLILEPKI